MLFGAPSFRARSWPRNLRGSKMHWSGWRPTGRLPVIEPLVFKCDRQYGDREGRNRIVRTAILSILIDAGQPLTGDEIAAHLRFPARPSLGHRIGWMRRYGFVEAAGLRDGVTLWQP